MTTIYVDGYCKGNPGPCGCRGVMDGKELFRYELGRGTNNIAEYVAITTAIKHCKLNGIEDATIFSDSMTAIGWVLRRESNSGATHPILARVDKYIRSISMTGIRISKWDTKKNGEIPADFGHKK